MQLIETCIKQTQNQSPAGPRNNINWPLKLRNYNLYIAICTYNTTTFISYTRTNSSLPDHKIIIEYFVLQSS